jgi:6-pyruvoyltetrahydropterin/6-carboxytetrahydropterin synthase
MPGLTSITRKYGPICAAHHLPYVPEGHRCKNVHGHNYYFEVEVQGDPLKNQDGFIIDFYNLDKVVGKVLGELDHTDLNDRIINPTAELIAAWVAAHLGRLPMTLYRVRCYEVEDCYADFFPGGR